MKRIWFHLCEIFALFLSRKFCIIFSRNFRIFDFNRLKRNFAKKRKFSHFSRANEMRKAKWSRNCFLANRFFLFAGNPRWGSQLTSFKQRWLLYENPNSIFICSVWWIVRLFDEIVVRNVYTDKKGKYFYVYLLTFAQYCTERKRLRQQKNGNIKNLIGFVF